MSSGFLDDVRQPQLHWEPDRIAVRKIVVWVTDWQFAWTAYMGDSKLHENTGPNKIEHTYAQPGNYWLHVTKKGELTVIGEAQIVVRAGRYPDVTFSRHPEMPNVARVHWPPLDETKVVSDYIIDWDPDHPDTIVETVTGYPGTITEHSYPEAGPFSVLITDKQTRRLRRFDPDLPVPTTDPDFSLTAAGHTVTLTVTQSVAGRPLVVAWGDGSLAEPLSGNTISHTYPSTVDNVVLVQLWYADASSYTTKAIRIPGGTS